MQPIRKNNQPSNVLWRETRSIWNKFQFLLLGALLMLIPQSALGQAAQEASIDTGDTAWILVATALVLFMNIPGLALFYGGLVRSGNVLSVLMQCFVLTAIMTLIWLGFGYSMAFSTTGMVEGTVNLRSFIGGLDLAMLRGVDAETVEGTIPKLLHFAFQMTFFIITPALMVGAFVERMKFSAVLWFSVLWNVLVYLPICHMVWGGAGGWFADMGVQDFAGGIVVHITAGVSALVACIVVGPRTGFPKTQMMPHNLTLTVTGAAMLWVGWFGFNGGSALGANGAAANAIVLTQISAATATLMWMCIEWLKYGRPSMLGAATGAIAGLAAITPASGTVGPVGALVIGAVSGLVCWWASTSMKRRLGYDDSLDVFGVHGVGGLLGTILLGVFMAPGLGGSGAEDFSIGKQVGVQSLAAVVTAVYSIIVSFALLKVIGAVIGLRVSQSEENQGMDMSTHGEAAYND